MACGPAGNESGICVNNASGLTPLYQNNHVITSRASWYTNSGTQTHTVQQTISQANAQGYNYDQTLPLSPTAASDATVGAGVNLSATCSGLSPLCSATTDGCSYDSSAHAVSCGATANPRPQGTAAWDAGAYIFGAASSAPLPAAPTGLTAIVQ
jgi:hypothetical protein